MCCGFVIATACGCAATPHAATTPWLGPRATTTGVSTDPPAGLLIITRGAIFDCPDHPCGPGPAGYFELLTAGPKWRITHLGKHRFATPIAPQISPDGHWIVFSDHRQQAVVQGIVPIAGKLIGTRVKLPVGRSDVATINWSPDSTQLLIAGTIGGTNGLWIINRDGSNLHRIVEGARVLHGQRFDVGGDIDDNEIPAWSASGEIAFTAGRPERGGRTQRMGIYVVAPDGSDLRAATHPVNSASYCDVSDAAPAWSPDGQMIAFQRADDCDVVYHARTVRLADGVERAIDREASSAPAWSPDGSRIAYLDEGENIRLVSSAGGRRSAPLSQGNDSGGLIRLDWRPA